MRFENKVVAVTGASRGIGLAIAQAFAQEGATVACIATSPANAQRTVEVIASAGGRAQAFGCDVSDASSVASTFEAIEKQIGPVQVLVNNAGITRDGLLVRMSESDWDQVLTTNLKGAFLCSKAVTRSMMKQRWGRIVNVSSIVGLHGAAGQANYAAAKAGLIGLTLSLAKELGGRGITANAVAPGFIETDMTANLPEEMKQSVIQLAPLGRLGSPKDVAGPVLFLASDEAGYMTGQVLTVDGGLAL